MPFRRHSVPPLSKPRRKPVPAFSSSPAREGPPPSLPCPLPSASYPSCARRRQQHSATGKGSKVNSKSKERKGGGEENVPRADTHRRLHPHDAAPVHHRVRLAHHSEHLVPVALCQTKRRQHLRISIIIEAWPWAAGEAARQTRTQNAERVTCTKEGKSENVCPHAHHEESDRARM